MIWNVQLVFDCEDPDELMIFWGHTLQHPWISSMSAEDLRVWRKDYPQYDGRGRIDDAEGRRIPVYMQKVPEPKSVRNRLRLELCTNDTSEARRTVEELGATSTGSGAELRDVEGNEFTIVGGLNEPEVDRVWSTVVIDCVDPDRMLEFWSRASEYPASNGRCDAVPGTVRMMDGWIEINGKRVMQAPRLMPASPDRVLFDLTPGIAFNKVDEPKTTKNRLHLDLHSTDVDADRERIEKMGATVQRWDTDHVLLDPEGNEFCLN